MATTTPDCPRRSLQRFHGVAYVPFAEPFARREPLRRQTLEAVAGQQVHGWLTTQFPAQPRPGGFLADRRAWWIPTLKSETSAPESAWGLAVAPAKRPRLSRGLAARWMARCRGAVFRLNFKLADDFRGVPVRTTSNGMLNHLSILSVEQTVSKSKQKAYRNHGQRQKRHHHLCLKARTRASASASFDVKLEQDCAAG